MPTYDYKCIACGTQIEQIKPFSKSGERPKCPTCFQMMERQFSRPEIYITRLRPHGFYPVERLKVKS